MKAIVEVAGRGSATRSARQQVTKARRGQSPDFHLGFGSARTLFAVLTPARVDLLGTLRRIGPCSIYALAKSAERNYSNVHADVARLGSTGAVVGVDLNPEMLAVARRLAPEIDWREGDACALPLRDDERFDIVLCQQGFQFFPDRMAAARQMHGALIEGGRLGVSTWRADEEHPVLHALRGIAERHVGPIADRRHGLGDPSPLEAILREAGFYNVRSKRCSQTIRFQDGSSFVRLNAMALVGMSRQAGTLDDERRQQIVDAIVADSAELVRSHSDDSGFAFEAGANVVLAEA